MFGMRPWMTWSRGASLRPHLSVFCLLPHLSRNPRACCMLKSDGKKAWWPDMETLALRPLHDLWRHRCTYSCLSNLVTTSIRMVGAAELPERRQNTRINTVLPLCPIGLWNPMGSVNTKRQAFLADLGRLLGQISGVPREASFLFQRLSVVIQCFDAIAFHGTFVTPDLEKSTRFLLMSDTWGIMNTSGKREKITITIIIHIAVSDMRSCS